MCSKENISDLLLNEMPVDLQSHIDYVNNLPNATWKAGHNDKFTGASHKEIKRLMGTIVDPDWTVSLHEKDFAEMPEEDFPFSFDQEKLGQNALV